MIHDILPAAVTTLGILYLGATFAACSLLSLDRKHERDLRKPFLRNGTAGVCLTVIGSILNLIQTL